MDACPVAAGYPPYSRNKARYGDWQTAAVDEHGNAWAAVEYVSGLKSAPFGNWATQIIKVSLS